MGTGIISDLWWVVTCLIVVRCWFLVAVMVVMARYHSFLMCVKMAGKVNPKLIETFGIWSVVLSVT
jgi:hypothetical protein